jgi:hypothetical protein
LNTAHSVEVPPQEPDGAGAGECDVLCELLGRYVGVVAWCVVAGELPVAARDGRLPEAEPGEPTATRFGRVGAVRGGAALATVVDPAGDVPGAPNAWN